MKPLKSKAEIRAEIEQQVDAYLQHGGEVRSVPQGASGRSGNENLFGNMGADQPPQSRTPLVEVVKQIEARKQKGKPATFTRVVKRPKRKLITDDFGEPVRWVWED